MSSTILCPIDGSDHAEKAAKLACDLTKHYGAKLCFLHVLMSGMSMDELYKFSDHAHLKDIVAEASDRATEVLMAGAYSVPYIPPPSPDVMMKIAGVIMEDARQLARDEGIAEVDTLIAGGDPATSILEQAEKLGADFIVMGHRGLGSVQSLFAGSVSNKVSHLSKCTCVNVK